MATSLGELTTYKRLYMQFRDSVAKSVNLTLNNPKTVEDGDYADFAAQDAAIEGVMDTIIAKNIFHNNGNDLVAKINARILDYKSTDVMDV
ncbi:MAG: DUF2922 domain-containing protein [Candidatus Atribacteria bacterium]|jgi:hypothetical protein|nr:DUF2922 domain-containing protein [Candidatus Atribacteria bacterium]